MLPICRCVLWEFMENVSEHSLWVLPFLPVEWFPQEVILSVGHSVNSAPWSCAPRMHWEVFNLLARIQINGGFHFDEYFGPKSKFMCQTMSWPGRNFPRIAWSFSTPQVWCPAWPQQRDDENDHENEHMRNMCSFFLIAVIASYPELEPELDFRNKTKRYSQISVNSLFCWKDNSTHYALW